MKETTLARLSVSSGEIHRSPTQPDRSGEGSWTAFVGGDCIYKGQLAADPVDDALVARIDAADVSVVNLEAPVRGRGEPTPKVGPAHASHPRTPEILVDAGFDVATLANNHMMDYGVGGLRETLRACENAGLSTVGADETVESAFEPTVSTVGDDVTLAVVNLCEREFGVADESAGTAWISHPSAERRVTEAVEKADAVVAVVHGGIEYAPFPPAHLQPQLRSLVDAGVDAVVAHHPHVPQGWEVYEGAPICYSVGNFLYDTSLSKTRWGVCVELGFDGTTPVSVDLVPTELADDAVRPLGYGETHDPDACLDYLERSARVIASRERLRRHWQELAVRMFDYRYAGWLRQGTASGPKQLLTDPRAAIGNETFDDRRQQPLLTLLNVIRNESHRDTIETALAVRGGEVEDRRTPEIKREVRELLAWTEEGDVYSATRNGGVAQLVESVFARLR